MVNMRHCVPMVVGLIAWFWPANSDAETFLYVSLASDEGIAVYQADESTGQLKYLRLHNLGTDPGPISVSADRKTIYVSLRRSGKLASFNVSADDGILKHLSTVTVDSDPAYHWPDVKGRYLLSAYYRTGKVALHRLASNGAILAENPQWYPTAHNAHGIAVDKENRRVYVTHTGANAIYQFELDAAAGILKPAIRPVIRTPEKSGPRHIALHPSKPFAYVDNEQGNSITFFRIVAKDLVPVETLSTIPDDWNQGGVCARLEMSADGTHVYVANRGHDSIAAFQVDQESGRMTSLGQVATEANPRSFTLHENGRFLYAGGQDTNRLAVFIRGKDGRLTRINTIETGKRPWWLQLVTIH